MRYCEERGVPAEALPRKDYRNPATGATTTRFFSPWKLPLAGSPDRATFVYADPGRDTVSELASWTAEHTRLWSSLRDAGVHVDVLVVARTVQGVDRATRWLDAKTAHLDLFEPGEQERFQRLDRALRSRDPELLHAEGGLMAVVRAHGALMRSRRARANAPPSTASRPGSPSGLPETAMPRDRGVRRDGPRGHGQPQHGQPPPCCGWTAPGVAPAGARISLPAVEMRVVRPALFETDLAE